MSIQLHQFSEEQSDIIIAALRLWQRTPKHEIPASIIELAENDRAAYLDDVEIDSLCEDINLNSNEAGSLISQIACLSATGDLMDGTAFEHTPADADATLDQLVSKARHLAQHNRWPLVLITVKQLVPDAELDPDDRREAIAGSYAICVGPELDDEGAEDAALTEFHNRIPIHTLDVFDIDASRVPTVPEGTREL
jgi:hypothetical protein